MNLGDGTNSCSIKLCRAFSDHYPSLIPQGKTPTIRIPVGKKGLYTDGRRASIHTQNKANTSPGKQQVNRAVPTKNFKAPLKLGPFFVFCLLSQKTTL